MQYKIIDLFAGPGGLGEGFSSIKNEDGKRVFEIVLSIEKDSVAHRTLLLRSFLRKFSSIPEEYYEYIRGEISKDDLFKKYPDEKKKALKEALNIELGNCVTSDKDNDEVECSECGQSFKREDHD